MTQSLKGRSFSCLSEIGLLYCEVLQGFILGALIALVYVNDVIIGLRNPSNVCR